MVSVHRCPCIGLRVIEDDSRVRYQIVVKCQLITKFPAIHIFFMSLTNIGDCFSGFEFITIDSNGYETEKPPDYSKMNEFYGTLSHFAITIPAKS